MHAILIYSDSQIEEFMLPKCKTTGCFGAATGDDGYCRSCKPSKRLRGYRTRPKPLFYKLPHGAFGAELETNCNQSSSKTTIATAGKFPTTDSSVTGPEFKFCGHCCRIAKKVMETAERAVALGATVDKRCGFHVHVDIRSVPKDMVDVAMWWLYERQEYFSKIVPPTRWDSGSVRPIYRVYTQPSQVNHYEWANVTEYGTIEIRLHPGTLNPRKIEAWMSYWAEFGHMIRIGELNAKIGPEDIPSKLGVEYLRARKAGKGTLKLGELEDTIRVDYVRQP